MTAIRCFKPVAVDMQGFDLATWKLGLDQFDKRILRGDVHALAGVVPREALLRAKDVVASDNVRTVIDDSAVGGTRAVIGHGF